MLHIAVVHSFLFCVVFHYTTFSFKNHIQDDHKFTHCGLPRPSLSLSEEDKFEISYNHISYRESESERENELLSSIWKNFISHRQASHLFIRSGQLLLSNNCLHNVFQCSGIPNKKVVLLTDKHGRKHCLLDP